MRRWFLSYNSQDLALMQAFEAALRSKGGREAFLRAEDTARGGLMAS
jgi:hypothetical protein